MGLKKLDVRILVPEIIRTPRNPTIIVRCTDFLGRECLDLGVDGSVSRNPNFVRICKCVRIIGRSLSFLKMALIYLIVLNMEYGQPTHNYIVKARAVYWFRGTPWLHIKDT